MSRPPFFVLVHDLGQTPLQWEELVTALPAGVGATCPWLRGTRPGGRQVEFSLADAAADVITALDENGAARADVVGAGVGGLVAVYAAARCPDRVNRVVALSAPMHPSARAMAWQRGVVRLMPRRALAARNIDKDRLLAAMRQVGTATDTEALRDLSVPLTLVVGEDDKASLAAAKAWTTLIPAAQVHRLPGQGQDLPRRASAAVGEILFAGITAETSPHDQDESWAPWDLS
ncbi:2-succinyl-6-hydroxy-2,4-cyclohexadiene-1-carboxylate synthase [Austwickia sp. TVS 96-490-7B]|uniref:alpha/beta fold hydrolase n=1 Tax=Austwickia sp. TVS 96-490-7B TaxID=2830843 RepID=UPI001C56EF65|nr:alpha/beta fold hydrolase [Austwickia sp. TVS 96-490-7B]MBW3085230.1 2-succinyl-6-hydroxy-2,4-cyclohexadiene-1-carboxylate synthase [Austwickia sp. TVS 96-490-7B]